MPWGRGGHNLGTGWSVWSMPCPRHFTPIKSTGTQRRRVGTLNVFWWRENSLPSPGSKTLAAHEVCPLRMLSLKLKHKFNCQIMYKQKLFNIIKVTTGLLLMKLGALWPVWIKPRHCCLLLQEVAVSSKIMATIYKTPWCQNPRHHNPSTLSIIKSSDLI
jgi:hypothetical protein